MPNQNLPTLLVKVIAGAFCLAFIALFSVNANYSAGHLYGHYADLYLKQWQKNTNIPTQQQWQQAHAQAHRANSINANNPLHLKRLGKLHELAGDFNQSPGISKQQHYETASEYYRQTLQVRSIWSWDWYNLFKIKTKLGIIDQQTANALAMTLKRDPNNYKLLINVIATGIPNMRIPAIKKAVNDATSHVLKHASSFEHRHLLRAYKAYQLETQFCLMPQVQSNPSRGLYQCTKILQ